MKHGRKIKRRKKPKKTGQKFSKRARFIVYEALRAKLPLGRAASLAGVHYKTLNEWMNKGKERPKSLYGDFRKRVKEIQVQHEEEALDIISKAAEGGSKIIETKLVIGPKGKEFVRIKKYTPSTWQAAAWYLERRHKEDYAREFNIKDGLSQQSPEDLARQVKEFADRLFESVPVG